MCFPYSTSSSLTPVGVAVTSLSLVVTVGPGGPGSWSCWDLSSDLCCSKAMWLSMLSQLTVLSKLY